ncbi:MAG: class I SAM-dependent methyltransferase [Deltaproteobacteria bacterium]|nr:class I SAM-dependent methyltransferase [Deltaproteobacteria bacterium]
MSKDDFSSGRAHRAIGGETGNSFHPGYLAAKKSIDDRALNHHVWGTLRQALSQTAGNEPVNILEIGAGIGTMFERIIDRELLKRSATYVATDSDPDQLVAASKYLSQWAEKRHYSLSWSSQQHGRLSTAKADVSLILDLASVEEFVDRSDSLGSFHLIIAHAVLDLVDFQVVLPQLFSRLKNNGLAYFTCNFDGETLFLPACDGDEEIIRRYHASMEERLSGASHTGRRLLTFLQRPGLELLAAGSSDWVIYPKARLYSKEEAFFLQAIIETVERELWKEKRPFSGLASWVRKRHKQIEAGELSFLARHLDILVRNRPSLPSA